MEFCQDAQFKLEGIPSSTVEYVASLTFLDDIQEKVKRSTVEPRFYDMARGQQNHIVKLGYHCKRTPDL